MDKPELPDETRALHMAAYFAQQIDIDPELPMLNEERWHTGALINLAYVLEFQLMGISKQLDQLIEKGTDDGR